MGEISICSNKCYKLKTIFRTDLPELRWDLGYTELKHIVRAVCNLVGKLLLGKMRFLKLYSLCCTWNKKKTDKVGNGQDACEESNACPKSIIVVGWVQMQLDRFCSTSIFVAITNFSIFPTIFWLNVTFRFRYYWSNWSVTSGLV